mmetsp:Transcript_19211/g.29123  ORF Transcript_19211/g.29123 Transcript_19211/m.29123 type:complete len:518 (-) Transcript_19211:131-1684(-)
MRSWTAQAWCIVLTLIAFVLLLIDHYLFSWLENSVRYQSLEQSRQSEGESWIFPVESMNHESIDVTIATQASDSRAWLLSFMCDRWPGEIVAAILTETKNKNEDDAASLISRTANEAACSSPRDSVFQSKISLEIFPSGLSQENGMLLETARLRKGRLAMRQFQRGKNASAYPINALRNTALAAVTTSHVLMLDVDFIPSIQLYEAISARRYELFTQPKLALVVPAFQRKENKVKALNKKAWQKSILLKSASRDLLAPATLNALSYCLAKANCIVFDSTWNPSGHATTDSAKWLIDSSHEMFSTVSAAISSLSWSGPLGRDPPSNLKNKDIRAPLRPIPCFHSDRYEPYLIVNKKHAPNFNRDFQGYGKNKIEFVTHLRYLGFHFAVLPVGFIIHLPHPISKDKATWLHQSRGKHDSDRLYKSAIQQIHTRINQADSTENFDNHTWLCRRHNPSKARKKNKKKEQVPSNLSSSSLVKDVEKREADEFLENSFSSASSENITVSAATIDPVPAKRYGR